MYKSIGNYLKILLIPSIPESDKVWSSYKIFCIVWNYSYMNDYAWNICAPSDCDLRPQECSNPKVEENRPPFFSKKIRVCFLQLFDRSTPKASNCDLMAHEYFTHNHSYKNSLKQCKISYNLIKLCQIRELNVSTESWDNFLCFCTLSM